MTVITFRHPAVLSGQMPTLDHISHGRVKLGIGAGGPENQYPMLGLDEWSPKERADRLAEQVARLDQFLRGGSIQFEGRYYRTVAPMMPVPIQQPRSLCAESGSLLLCLQPFEVGELGFRLFLGLRVAPNRGSLVPDLRDPDPVEAL